VRHPHWFFHPRNENVVLPHFSCYKLIFNSHGGQIMPDLQQYTGILLLGLAALAVIIIALLIFKTFNQRVRGRRGQRLGITEYHEIDKTRRLVLVRRDDMEHLVLIGGHQDLVIESGIEHGLMSETPRAPQLNDPIPIRSAPRPAVFGDRRPPLRPVSNMMRSQEDDDQAS
jgi:Flagellar biosynthesis protein, FliO